MQNQTAGLEADSVLFFPVNFTLVTLHPPPNQQAHCSILKLWTVRGDKCSTEGMIMLNLSHAHSELDSVQTAMEAHAVTQS